MYLCNRPRKILYTAICGSRNKEQRTRGRELGVVSQESGGKKQETKDKGQEGESRETLVWSREARRRNKRKKLESR